jgi:hypothetical protein
MLQLQRARTRLLLRIVLVRLVAAAAREAPAAVHVSGVLVTTSP